MQTRSSVKLKEEIKQSNNPVEASQWTKCLQSFVTANAIHFNLKHKSNS